MIFMWWSILNIYCLWESDAASSLKSCPNKTEVLALPSMLAKMFS